MRFRGTFEHALDAKHRLTIPARFRGVLADGVVLAPSPEIETGGTRNVAVWTPEAFDAYLTRMLETLNPANAAARELSRILNNLSFDTELDSAHRVMIPPHLRSYAGLGREVTVTGSGDFLEVWDRAAHTHDLDVSLDRYTELVARLDHTA